MAEGSHGKSYTGWGPAFSVGGSAPSKLKQLPYTLLGVVCVDAECQQLCHCSQTLAASQGTAQSSRLLCRHLSCILEEVE